MAYYKNKGKWLCASCNASYNTPHGGSCAYSSTKKEPINMEYKAQGAGMVFLGCLCFTLGMMYANWALGHRLERVETKCGILPPSAAEVK